jgi:hypothetical protein
VTLPRFVQRGIIQQDTFSSALPIELIIPSGIMLDSNQRPLDFQSNKVCCKYPKNDRLVVFAVGIEPTRFSLNENWLP